MLPIFPRPTAHPHFGEKRFQIVHDPSLRGVLAPKNARDVSRFSDPYGSHGYLYFERLRRPEMGKFSHGVVVPLQSRSRPHVEFFRETIFRMMPLALIIQPVSLEISFEDLVHGSSEIGLLAKRRRAQFAIIHPAVGGCTANF